MDDDQLEEGRSTGKAPNTLTSDGKDHSGASSSAIPFNSGRWDKYLPLDATSPRCCSWDQLKYFLFPVEVAVFFYMFATYFHFQIYQQYFFQQSARDALNLSSDYVGCLNETEIIGMSSNETFYAVQYNANRIQMITAVIAQVPSIFVLFPLGAISDRYGRKPIMYLVFLGVCVSAIIGIIIVYFNLSMYFFILSGFVAGITGGFGAMLLAGISYVVDITPKRWLTIRSGLLQVAIFVGTASSSGSTNSWLGSNGCDFRPPVWLLIVVGVVGLLYVLITPESLTEVKIASLTAKPKRGLRSLLVGVKIFLWPPYLGSRKLWRLWLALLVMSLAVINEVGNVEILVYYLQNEPLSWSLTRISLYNVAISVSHCLALVVVLPVLVILKLPDSLIALIGVTVACGVSATFGYAQNSWPYWVVFIAGTVLGLEAMITPSLRSMMAKLVGPDEQGAMFSILATIEITCTIISTVIYNNIYHPSEVVDGRTVKAGVAYWFMAILWLAAIPFLLCLLVGRLFQCCKLSEEKRPLVASFSSNRNDSLVQ